MDVSFLSPNAALIGLAVAIPLAASVLRERRYRHVRRTLRLEEPRARCRLPAAVALSVAFGLLAAAAAQPVARVESEVERRTDAEAFVLFDITRSMLAARSPDSPKRIERAINAAVELRRQLPDVPFGVGSLTNRPLPHLFPSVDAEQFERVVREAIGVNRPPASEAGLFGISTDFQSIEAIATDNWFSPPATKRLVVLLSDGESDPFAVRHLVNALDRAGVDLVLVRFWERRERVWSVDRTAEAYRPLEGALVRLSDLAALTTGGRIYGEGEIDAAAAAARRYLGRGPVVPVKALGRTVSLAPYAALAACIPIGLLLVSALAVGLRVPRPSPRLRRTPIAYSMLLRWLGFSRTARPRSHGAPASLPRSLSAPRSSTDGSSPGNA